MDRLKPPLKKVLLKKRSKDALEKVKEKASKSSLNLSPLRLSVEIPDIFVWAKDEPFLFGVISPTPNAKVGVQVLRRVAEYCRDRKGYFPEMKYEQWIHISKYKLQLSIELCWTYIRAFQIVKGKLRGEVDGMLWDAAIEEVRLKSADKHEVLKVDTLDFLLYLFIQNYRKLHRKSVHAKCVNVDDHWPVTASASGSNSSISGKSGIEAISNSSSCSKCSLKYKAVPEHVHGSFLEHCLEEMLDYLCIPFQPKKEKKPGSEALKRVPSGQVLGPGQEHRLPLQVVKSLNMILGIASVSGSRKDSDFPGLETFIESVPVIGEALGLDRSSGTIDKSRFITWIKEKLKLNPWGPSSVPVSQKMLPFTVGIWEPTKAYENNRTYWNGQKGQRSWILLTNVSNQVILLDRDSFPAESSIRIHRCTNAYIYIPFPVRSALIEKCHNCTIYHGPAERWVRFIECSNLKVLGVGRMFQFQDTGRSVLHLLTPCHPVICGGKGRKLVFGPYNTFYPKLEEDMEKQGMVPNIQKGTKPLEIDGHGGVNVKGQIKGDRAQPVPAAYAIMRPEDFGFQAFPFEMEGKTDKIMAEFPRNYGNRVQCLLNISGELREKVEKMDFTAQQTKELESVVQKRFRNWLKKQGHLEHLLGLKSMQDWKLGGEKEPKPPVKKSVKAGRKGKRNEESSFANANAVGDVIRRNGVGSESESEWSVSGKEYCSLLFSDSEEEEKEKEVELDQEGDCGKVGVGRRKSRSKVKVGGQGHEGKGVRAQGVDDGRGWSAVRKRVEQNV